MSSSASATSKRGQGVLVAFSSGAVSATASTLMFQPLDLVKTRMQSRLLIPSTVAPVYIASSGGATISSVGMVSTFSTVVRSENMVGLWKGIAPSLHRCVPSIGVYFATLHFLKTTFRKTDKTIAPLQAAVFGAGARAVAATTFLPFTVVKTRYESGLFQYRNVPSAIKSIWLKEGFKGLSLGYWPTILRDVPFSAFYVLFYTQSKQAVMRALGTTDLPVNYSLPCGLVAGLLASATTQPADVIKTRMQVRPESFSNITNTILTTIKDGGLRGLFVGFAPRATRRTLMASFTWAFYERINQFISERLQ